MGTTFTADDVAAFEHATWSRCAPGYDDGFAVLTGEAIESLLEAAGVATGSRVLDVGTGTGTAAAAARDRGARVTGIDFSEAMIAEARRKVTDVEFRTASADSLPFDDGSFDAVVANGVLHHLGDPDRALQEACRVLVPGGRIACTVWAAPETLQAFGVFFAAVEEHAGSADLPHGPLFGVADEETLSSLLTDNGFTDVSATVLDTVWRMESIDTLLRAFGTWAQLDAFPDSTRASIEASVREAALAYASGDGLEIPNPMVLIQGARPQNAGDVRP